MSPARVPSKCRPAPPGSERPLLLSRHARALAIFARVKERLVGRGLWHPSFELPLSVFALVLDRYLRAQADFHRTPLGPEREVFAAELAAKRAVVRAWAREFLIVDHVHVAPLTAEGLDADLAELLPEGAISVEPQQAAS